jgi:hypothetical protein
MNDRVRRWALGRISPGLTRGNWGSHRSKRDRPGMHASGLRGPHVGHDDRDVLRPVRTLSGAIQIARHLQLGLAVC